jgi:F-type H+-transporting ATPase subunit b
MEFHLIDFIEHALNVLILFLLLRTFLYKPVRKFMQEREAKFAREREQIDASRTEADTLKAQSSSR